MEFALDLFPKYVAHFGLAQPSNADTMKDLFDDFIGAVFAFSVIDFVRSGKK